ncbi:hypothetical protein PG984_012333 [Apiospora sp. TS-2023a]
MAKVLRTAPRNDRYAVARADDDVVLDGVAKVLRRALFAHAGPVAHEHQLYPPADGRGHGIRASDARAFNLAAAEDGRDALYARSVPDLCRFRDFAQPEKGADELEGAQGDIPLFGPFSTRVAVPTDSCANVAPDARLIWSLIQIVNSEDRSFVCRWNGADEEEKEEGWEHYTWAFVGGMEWSEDHLRKKTLPRLTELFNHDMHTFLPYRLGFPRRHALEIPSTDPASPYANLDGSMNILVHNTGALDMAWVMSRLCADLPPGQQLGKFNVYTFGSAMPEMTLPLGSHNGHEGHNCNCEDFPEYPIVSHYAFEDDPFARVGVFLGVRQRMEGRVVGAVYGLQSQGSRHRRRSKSWFSSGGRFTMDDYLDALFPDNNPRAGALGEVCKIERDVSEMRELSALAKAVREVSRKGKRLSWTALGALAGNHSHCRNDRNEMAGIVSLEETRRIGKSLEGILGYENNLLAAFVRGDYRLHLDEQKGFQTGCDECD